MASMRAFLDVQSKRVPQLHKLLVNRLGAISKFFFHGRSLRVTANYTSRLASRRAVSLCLFPLPTRQAEGLEAAGDGMRLLNRV